MQYGSSGSDDNPCVRAWGEVKTNQDAMQIRREEQTAGKAVLKWGTGAILVH